MALLGGLENGRSTKRRWTAIRRSSASSWVMRRSGAQNERPEALASAFEPIRIRPGQFRVIGVVQNMPEFAKAFGCSAGQPMVAANACRVW